MTSTDVYLHPDAPDPVLDEAVVVATAREHASGVGRLLEVDESGGEARAYHLEGGVVLKTQRPHRLRPRTSLSKECLILEVLERAGGVPVPRALGYGHVEGIEYLCQTTMPGRAVEQLSLSAEQRRAFLGELGATLRRIHEVGQGELVASGLVPGDEKPADLRVRVAETFDRLLGALESDPRWGQVAQLRGVTARHLDRLPDDVTPVVLHSNPGPEHAFADPRSFEYTGVIDFGDAYRSHPALDLRPWSMDEGGSELLAGYHGPGPLPDSFDDVWRTGLVIMELARASRGMRTPEELTESLAAITET
jgi:aminoglycoside phosphotransferase (APT) family kinase protein